jgi:protease IV
MKILMLDPSFITTYADKHKLITRVSDSNMQHPRAMRKVKCDDDEESEMEPFVVEDSEKIGRSVAVYEISGMIVKDDYWYYNMCDLMDDLAENEADPEVIAHVLCVDSGGGEATNIDTVARYIRSNIAKPVLVHVNGFACSAAYYLSAGADKIYASEPTDIFGSIGTVITLADYAKMYESMGIELHEIYADQSTEKNQDYKLALAGKYEAIKQDLLNPYTAQFVKTVNEMRTITDDGHVFAGKTYMTEAAQAIGLIDGQRTFEAVLEEAIQLGTQFYNQTKIQMTTINMSAPRIAAALGIATDQFVAQDGHVSVRAEDFAAIEAALATVATPAPEAEVVTSSDAIAELRAQIDNMKVEAAEKLAAVNDQLAEFKSQVSAGPIAVPRGDASDSDPAADEREKIIAAERKMFG